MGGEKGGGGEKDEKERLQRTQAHHAQKARAEPAEVHHGAAGALDEVVRVGAAATYPVRQRRQHVRRDDQQRQILVEEGAGEDHEEEADGEDLLGVRAWTSVGGFWNLVGGEVVFGEEGEWKDGEEQEKEKRKEREAYEGEGDDGFEAGGHFGGCDRHFVRSLIVFRSFARSLVLRVLFAAACTRCPNWPLLAVPDAASIPSSCRDGAIRLCSLELLQLRRGVEGVLCCVESR